LTPGLLFTVFVPQKLNENRPVRERVCEGKSSSLLDTCIIYCMTIWNNSRNWLRDKKIFPDDMLPHKHRIDAAGFPALPNSLLKLTASPPDKTARWNSVLGGQRFNKPAAAPPKKFNAKTQSREAL
jgi:hypothetical protein